MNNPIDDIIKASIDALPKWCKGEGEESYSRATEWHEWENAYGPYNSIEALVDLDLSKTFMLPYYVCKHCSAVSTNFTDSPSPKRVR